MTPIAPPRDNVKQRTNPDKEAWLLDVTKLSFVMAYFLSSSRLGFRHWTEADLPLAESLWMDAGVMTHMGGPMTAEQAKARLELERTRQTALGISYWPIFHLVSGEHVGCAGLRPFHDEPRVYELGVHIARKFW